MKFRIGIIFGGSSREREVSFAGGRTVYDNLDKSIFEAIPLFVDSFGNLILLNWELIYKGSIRDFYPPVELLPDSPNEFQVYAESLGELTHSEQLRLINGVGTCIEPSALNDHIDFAFLCLHGSDGEDGRIQGLLEFFRIPYSGSGIFSSSIGMNKALQKILMKQSGFDLPRYEVIGRTDWINDVEKLSEIFKRISESVGFPCVIKSANQGSSIGVTVLTDPIFDQFKLAVDKSFFIHRILKKDWLSRSYDDNVEYIRQWCDIRHGIGIPVKICNKIIAHPEELFSIIRQLFSEDETEVIIESCEGETQVLVEQFLEGKEFSCIVIENDDGSPVALPPTEIRKVSRLFDYRSKYLPGLSRKITPVDLPADAIHSIMSECENLFSQLHFNVYARIDGFYTNDHRIILNDPNTTSGMMPSSFFFHQAAEIGLNPSQFITYIIRTSLKARLRDLKNYRHLPYLIQKLDQHLESNREIQKQKIKVVVLMGGYSSERHISVESGRNIYEKLSSSEKYDPVPVFLTGSADSYSMYRIPINLLLKDNADDIKEKVLHFKRHDIILEIINRCKGITRFYSSELNLAAPERIAFEQLAQFAGFVFIALHGRPGEDGEVQRELDRVGVPYNGSGPESSQITIDKFSTNELLVKAGLNAAKHILITEKEWRRDPAMMEDKIKKEFLFPFVAKPVDDGCSSAVKIIRTENEFHAYAELIFRKEENLNASASELLGIRQNEEFPVKNCFMVEQLITKMNAVNFLEITGGLLTHYDQNQNIFYEIFEASEALSMGDVLSLEEKFLAGQGQNITPARYHSDPELNASISEKVKTTFEKAARILQLEGYARIDAFVRIYPQNETEVIFIEVNSLPGMTPATCIFHQAAIAQYKPHEFIDQIIEFGIKRKNAASAKSKF